ncbi:DUF1254 domain-containing protein [Rhizobium ruizarguesonis]|uniref:DUF1254 domain-containing protein n=1 Tax=Rhizobium ruizarguesonis TaxID=2081791 RepID=UPI001030ABF7|nr:DUF1254 domain-containing protein [Rhizobium ruizarguesonis]NKJ76512.1 DUF1214 domain-containing protein [Rhizobium leguminosarum bv. viciae]NEJ16251.1 DUF1254 domain-containing protein [Rhizobium ruizarguesonis]NEK30172.1 DUF1254 domain-containing protein [Rhizobium ruizarguesonis]NKQ81466.1 hypothetical protein [Rhizobium ruizarguesonis]TAZ93797.1 DUF1254 domain-containing protein [Rhizobium ruizarguesonis]
MTPVKSKLSFVSALVAATIVNGGNLAFGETAGKIPPILVTPDKVESRIGTLEFKDGAPSQKTVDKVYDTLDFTRALDAFLNSYGGASAYAIRKGLLSIGAEDNTVTLYPELMDSKSLFLTANADTVYYFSIVDLTKGPIVVEQPPMGVGTINDMWFGWIIDVGFPGPDRGEGGRYLLLPPGYDGPVPEGGFYVARSKTNRVIYASRGYLVDNDPKPTVENIKNMKIYPYTPGGVGTSIATALEGKVRLEANPPVPETKFLEASGKAFNTIPPSDYSFFEMINANVQDEPADSYNPELAGQLAAIGIVKGKEFKPDDRMKKILTDAAAVGNAASRALNWRFSRPHPDWSYYPDSMWGNMLWQGGANFETPPPTITKEGLFDPLPPTGARTLDSKTAFYFGYTLDSPGMIMRLPKVGSQYLMGFLDANKNDLDGGKTYKVTLPKDIPAAAFWSFTLYDNQSRSMLQTPQGYPRAGSQSYPSPAAEAAADGSTTIYFGPTQPQGVKRGNWIQTMPGKGWFTLLRLYSPLESFFTKEWRLSEIELVP